MKCIEMQRDVEVSIDDYLTDHEVSPKPVSKLLDLRNLYFEQMLICSIHWAPDERLAVGSIMVGQPLAAQGAADVKFVMADGFKAETLSPNPTFTFQFDQSRDEYFCVEILGPWVGVKIADVNSPAGHARMRMAARELKLEDQYVYLYDFCRRVASSGLGISLNHFQHLMAEQITAESAITLLNVELRQAERELIKSAVEAMNKFEGRDPCLPTEGN